MSDLCRRYLLASLPASVVALALPRSLHASPAISPPPTRVDPVTDEYFGTKVVDRYRWMETQPRTQEFKTWLQAQASFARNQLDALPGRAAIMRGLGAYLVDQEFGGLLATEGGRLFILRQEAGQQAVRLHMREREDGAERLIVDPGSIGSASGTHTTLEEVSVAPTGKHVAFGISSEGDEITSTYLLDIEANKTLLITRISSKACGWTADGLGFFYYRLRANAQFGAADYQKGGSCWLHMIGSEPSTDVEVFRSGEGAGLEAQESDTPVVKGAPGSDWVVGTHLLNDTFANQVYVARANEIAAGHANWRKIADRAANVQDVHIVGDSIYLIANGRQSAGELVKVNAQDGHFETSPVVLVASAGVIDKAVVARDGLYIHDLTDGMGGLRRVGFDGTIIRVTPPRTGAIWSLCAERDQDGAWFGMDDLTQFGQTFHLVHPQIVAQLTTILKPPAFSVAEFQTTRTSIRERDGAEVPVEILHRRGMKLDGANPVLIHAYGAYGTILDPGFASANLAFLAQGGAIVYAHVRGGGEKGEAWHNAGRQATKPNTWRDAIDTAEWLIANNWTAKQHLALMGESAGGIMVGRAITERPDLFAAAVCTAGEVNALRTEFTANGPGNSAEFGTVKTPEGFRALLAQDVIQAIRDGVRYPAVLVMVGANDQRVEPWESGKLTARLQAASTNQPGALLRVDYEGGHFNNTSAGETAFYADIFTFVLAHTA